MSEQKLSPEEVQKLKAEGKLGKIDIDVDANNPEARKFVQEILKKKDEQQTQQPDLADKKIQVFQKFHDSRALDCQTTEELRDLVTQIIDSRAPRQTPTGSAPLNQAQYGQKDDLYTHHYSDFGSMVSDLTEKMRNAPTEQERREAQDYYNSLLKKWVQTQKRNPEVPSGFYDPNLPENLPSDLKRTPEGFLVSENEGDLQKLQARWRAERLRKMGINDKGEVVQ